MLVLNDKVTANDFPNPGAGGCQLEGGPQAIAMELEIYNATATVEILYRPISGHPRDIQISQAFDLLPQIKTFSPSPKWAPIGFRAKSSTPGTPATIYARVYELSDPYTLGVASAVTSTVSGGQPVPFSGSISEITSLDGSVTVTDPFGPIVDLSAAVTVGGGGIPGLLEFVQIGADTSVTATTQAAADVVMSASPIVFDGNTTIRIDMDALTQIDMRFAGTPGGNGGGVLIELWEDGVFYNGLIDFGLSGIFGVGNQSRSVYLTPTAGSHTYSIRAYRIHGAGVGFPDVTIFKDVIVGEPTFASNFTIVQINPLPS